MKSRTSFFNAAVLRKDLTRFAPVWVLYTVFLLLCMTLLYDNEIGRMAATMAELTNGMAVVNFLYAGLCAAVLFGDLFNARLCNALHALPMRREGWFLTHLTAGLLFCLIPCGFTGILGALLLQKFYYVALLWLAVTVLQFLFFFGVGALSALCAGNRFAMCGVYAILNFLSLIARWLISIFYEPLLHGVVIPDEPFQWLCPVVQMCREGYINGMYGKPEGFYFFGIIPESWTYLGICAVVGVVLFALAVLLYRRRKLESAGDFIAVQALSPVFLVIYTLGVGAVMHGGAALFSNELEVPFLIVGFIVGFFTGRMLLERKVNVFRGKNFLGFAVFGIALFISVALTWLDPLGITLYVPDSSRVESVSLATGNMSYRYGDTIDGEFVLTDAADIDAVRSLHAGLVSHRYDRSDAVNLTLEYRLKGGGTLKRVYAVDTNSDPGRQVRQLMSRWQCVFFTDDWDVLVAALSDVNGEALPEDALPGLLEAIRADCDAGNMVQDWKYHPTEDVAAWITLCLRYPQNKDFTVEYIELRIYESCTNTVAYLKEHSKVDEWP